MNHMQEWNNYQDQQRLNATPHPAPLQMQINELRRRAGETEHADETRPTWPDFAALIERVRALETANED